MKTKFSKTFLFIGALLTIVMLASCKNKEPSLAKIFVRSNSNQLMKEARVIIIGDVTSDPETFAYVDTLFTNSSGFVTFDLTDYYTTNGEKENPVAYFDVIAKKETKTGYGRVRCRVHVTSVETVFLPE